jgi:mannose-1-phosphate guanylyltransferase
MSEQAGGGETVQVVILAGGLGTRLGPLTREVPKPMVPVAGRPYLEHQLCFLRRQQLRDVVLLIGYLGSQIEDYFGNGYDLGLSIRYSRENKPLGTGGALSQATPLLEETFLVLYGDSYLPINYREVTNKLASSETEAVLVVYNNLHGDTSVRNNILLDEESYVVRYEKDAAGTSGLTHVDAGVVAIRRSALSLCKGRKEFSLEDELYTELIARRRLLAYETRQRFYDIGTPERLKVIESYLGS